ncbi:MAG TPA: SpoIIE family protein phosphatase [Edaphobacter sp.]|nr:SpoIIE family protein phosphatase [Edaphobacter sp.]
MPQKPARLQYFLLAIVATLALLHAFGSARFSLKILMHGDTMVRAPFYCGEPRPTITNIQPEGTQAGLARNDTVLSVNGLPFTGITVLYDQIRHASAGDTMTIEYRRPPSDAIKTTVVQMTPVHPERRPIWEIALQIIFTVIPIFCIFTGLWVVFARPRNPSAWLILGILCYFEPVFINNFQIAVRTLPLTLFWNAVVQTAMPLCLMLLGVYFPQRSPLDVRVPWVKWLIIVPILLFFPLDLLTIYRQAWNFALFSWLNPYLYKINTAENLIGMAAIFWFFINLGTKLSVFTGDARRRLRILYIGTSVGLTPFFILVVISLIHRNDVGQDIPQWIDFASFLILLLFPLTLAYVVVVQRAMDVRILIRQGTKYFFAKQSVVIISILLVTWMSYNISLFFARPNHRRTVDIVHLFAIIAIFFAFRFVISKRLQQRIDQRFFREAYSAEHLLAELSDEARNFTEVEPLLTTITHRIGDTLHIDRIAVFLRAGDTYRLQFAIGAPVSVSSFTLLASSTTITTLNRGRAPANVYRDDPSSWLVDASDAERSALADLSTELLVPLPGRNSLAGVMALGPKRSEEPYSRTDRQLLQSIASQTGLALENAELLHNLTTEVANRERVSREIEIAREVQQRLFPQVYPKVPGVDLAGYCRPAQAVGGDYYDFFVLPAYQGDEERLALALGDISGKGISAALLMASLRASLRSAALLQPGDLATLMRHVNRLVYESSTTNRYATFFYAELDPQSRVLTYVNAGHNPPVILRGDQVISLEATGTVIGLIPDAPYTRAGVLLQPGDALLCFTDGISEAMTQTDEEWGEDRMIACAQQRIREPECNASAQQILDCILEAADTFTAGAPQHDDMTLLVCTIR